jgi:hypothetical protein
MIAHEAEADKALTLQPLVKGLLAYVRDATRGERATRYAQPP